MTDITNNELFARLLNAIKDESGTTKEEIKNEIRIENKKICEIIQALNKKVIDLENNCSKLESKCIHLERQVRKNNIVIFGLNINLKPEETLLDFMLAKIEELLEVKLVEFDIDNIYQMKTGKETPVKIVCFLP